MAKNQRKNQYEEALFRCEDEQFEMDMMIDQNDSAVMRMRTLAAQIESMKVKARNPNEVYRDFRLTTNSLGELVRVLLDSGTHSTTLWRLSVWSPCLRQCSQSEP